MLSEIIEKRIDEISSISDELSYILPRKGWTEYAISLFNKMQKLSDDLDEEVREDGMIDALKNAWITTENNHKIHIGDDGNPDKGNPHVLEAIEGALKSTEAKQRKGVMKCESAVEFEKPGSITRDKFGRVVTHFNHDENTMKITKQIRLEDKIGKGYKICRENIEHLTVFASADVGKGVKQAEHLTDQVGGDKAKWKHVKGIGTVVDKDGNKRKADIHWFENPESGQVGWKIKQFLEDMDESEIYWEE